MSDLDEAEREYRKARRDLEDLQQRYDLTLIVDPLRDDEPIPSFTSEQVTAINDYRRRVTRYATATQQLLAVRDARVATPVDTVTPARQTVPANGDRERSQPAPLRG